jgi:hypothetical protein
MVAMIVDGRLRDVADVQRTPEGRVRRAPTIDARKSALRSAAPAMTQAPPVQAMTGIDSCSSALPKTSAMNGET